MKQSVLILFLLLNVLFATSQGIVKQADGLYNFKQYTLQDGFIGSVVENVFQDSKGHVWCSTRKGLNRITGNTIKYYNQTNGLPSDDIKCAMEDVDGYIWIGTEKGLSRFDGSNFTNYVEELDYPHIWALAAHPDGGILLGTIGGVDYIKNGKVTHFLDIDTTIQHGNWVRSLNYDSEGLLWVGTKRGMYKISRTNTPEKIAGVNHALGWAEEVDGTIWMSGWDKYIYRLKEGSIDKFNVGTPVTSIRVNEMGDVWFATWEKGILRWDDGQFIQYDVLNGLPSSTVWNIFIDNENSLWCATYDGGVCQLINPQFSIYNKVYGLTNNVINSVVSDEKGNIWAATEGGVVRIDSAGSVRTWTTKDGLSSNKVQGIVRTSNGDIWFVVYYNFNGSGRITNNKLHNLKYQGGLFITEGSDGSILIGSEGGGMRVIDEGGGVKEVKVPKIRERVYCVGEDINTNIWMGAERRGFNILSDDSLYSLISPKHFDGLSGIGIKKDYKGNLWVQYSGRNYGLYQVVFNEGKIEIIDSIGAPEIKTESRISAYFPDGNNMWLTTVDGLIKMNLDDFYNNKPIRLKTWNRDDGFLGEDCRDIIKTTGNRLLIASIKGVTVYHPKQDKQINSEPFTEIIGVKLFKKKVDWKSKGVNLRKDYPVPQNIALDYNENYLTFTFNGISHSAPEAVLYRYYMEGFDSEWSPTTLINEATYSNLPAGEYVFKVQCQNIRGVWDNSPDEILIIINKPFWEEVWFRVLITISGILFIIFVIRLRLNKLKKAKEKLEETVNIRTIELQQSNDELGERNKQIMDSITYAKRIQSAILPPAKVVKEYFQESFILYKPKDIIAGDFYWMEQKEGKILFAAADCTGHGVPGAMVSVVCNNAMNRAVREFGLTEPGLILDKTREIVIAEFEKSDDDVKDGMDIALCSINGMKLQYAGAHNPLWIIRNKEILETKADIQPIGKFDNPLPYKTHNIELQKGDSIYLFTDGFADQFGGEADKKFGNKQFKELLLSNQDKTIQEQKELLDTTFKKWMQQSNAEQLDDVCVMGVKI